MNSAELFARIRSGQSPTAEPAGPVSEAELVALEERVGQPLPAQFREFLLELGPGDYRFGRIFSPAPVNGSSELEDELLAFQEDEQAQMVRAFSLQPRRPSVSLLPFGRTGERLWLFDLAGRVPADRVWLQDTLVTPYDEPTPTDETFFEWLVHAQYIIAENP